MPGAAEVLGPEGVVTTLWVMEKTESLTLEILN